MGNMGYACKKVLGLRPNLLIRLDWNLGDEIMSLPLFPALRRKYPAEALFVQARHPEIFLNNPCVDGVNPNSWSVLDKVLDIRKESRPTPRLQYWENLLGVKVQNAQPALFFSESEKRVIEQGRTRAHPTVVLSSAAHWRSRRWKTDSFRALAESLSEKIPTLKFIEIGKDCPFLGLGQNYIDKTNVREAALILASSDLFIGSDSGLMHLAAAAGTRALALFGPVEPKSLVGQNRFVFPVEPAVDCRGCWTFAKMKKPDECPLGEPICLDSITPEEVARRALSLLG